MKYSISIIIPVWNEASVINETIEHIFNLSSSGGFEVIVVDGSPDGKTINAVERKEVKKMIAGRGRARQMNAGGFSAAGEILLFLHADTQLPNDALMRIGSLMESKDVVGGAFDLAIRSDRRIFRIIETAASLRSRATRIPYGDQGIFLRKEYFYKLGGFREITLMEDVELMRRIKRAGDKISILHSKATTSPRRWEREGILYCTLRNWMLISGYLLGIPAENLSRFYK